MARHAFRSVVPALFVLALAACGDQTALETTGVSAPPAVITEATTTTTSAPPPTTTTTEPEPEPAPVTTVARPRPTTTVPRATQTTLAARPAPASTGTGACGGDLPPCSVMRRESGGDPTAIGYGQCGTKANPRNCQGKWQIDPDTAESVGYPRDLANQPEHVQDDAARAILARDGCGAWSTC